jgi:hypothetical protein
MQLIDVAFVSLVISLPFGTVWHMGCCPLIGGEAFEEFRKGKI